MMDLGFHNLEVLSCIHPKIAPAMHEQTLREISKTLGRREDVHIITLVPNLAGYRTFCSLGLGPEGYNHTLGVFFSAVEAHNRANLGRSIDDTVAEYKTMLKDAARRHIRVVAYLSAVFGYLDPEKGAMIKADLTEVVHYMDMWFDLGVQTVTLSDLQGVAEEKETARILEKILDLRKGKDRERMGYHPHHVSGDQALANSKTAFNLGIRRFDASLGGTGGCITGAPGNQPTEKLVQQFSEAGVETGIKEQGLVALAHRVERALYRPIVLSPSGP